MTRWRPPRGSTRAGVQREILASLALVMGLSSLMLAALFVARGEASLRTLLGSTLFQEAQAPRADGTFPGTDWWIRSPDGVVRPYGGVRVPIDGETLALGERAARSGETLLQPGAPWSPIRFATPAAGSTGPGVLIARLPRESSLELRAIPMAVLLLLLLANVAAFTTFGAFLLRRRVIGPLQDLAAVARARAQGEDAVLASPEGVAEVAEVARDFNRMTQGLEEQRLDLTKAVVELREANDALRQTRDGLDRAERLAAVGRLAAGVAHEVGNPMGSILALLDLAGRDEGLSEATQKHLARASREGERVRVILRQLLDFSRPSAGRPVPLDLEAAARETVGLVAAQQRYREVVFEVEPCGPQHPVRADPGMVGQILLNLAINAADACLSAEGGKRVRFELRAGVVARRDGDPVDAGAERLRRQPDAMECHVLDTGCGIAEADRERVFDPFFTTKDPGQGTGLGLSNASRQAEEQGGTLRLGDPPAGFATALVLRLPVPTSPGGEAREETRGAQNASRSAGDCAP